jgi:hypothetical protein
MPTAYTPGLLVTRRTRIRKFRRLPIKGEVLVKVGEEVGPETVVARALRPGPLYTIKVADDLGLEPNDVRNLVKKKEGDRVEVGEVVAEVKSLFGLFTSTSKSRYAGKVEFFSPTTGHIGVRGEPIPIEVRAYLSGRVVEVAEGEGATIEANGALIQGIFGVGGEKHGEIMALVEEPDAILGAEAIPDQAAGKILVGGGRFTLEAMRKAEGLGVAALVSGGMLDTDLAQHLGYEIGVAITGEENIRTAIIITEGFGEIPMAARTFALLRELEGKEASVSGATQIRAGVMRPEIIVPGETAAAQEKRESSELAVGTRVRLIREPYFGLLAAVSALPNEPQIIETGARVRVLEARLDSGEAVVVPRANVEIIEE